MSLTLTRRRLGVVAASGAATLLLAACGSSDASGGNGGSAAGSDSGSGQFPVTIEHAFGETTIEAKPERVATVAWANQEVPLALGIVPVGMAKVTYGDDDGDGVLPWVEEKLTELGAKTPTLYDESEGIDFEAVADSRPDVILAAYSGITQEEYDTLSKIAPVVAYPDQAWGTSLEDMVEMDAEAMGMEAEGERLNDDLDQQVKKAVADRPDMKGKTVMFASLDPSDLSQVGFYTSHDPRPAFLEDYGMEQPKVVEDASEGTKEYYSTISAEEAGQLDDVDVIIAYGTDELMPALKKDPLLSKVPAVQRGSVVVLEDNTPIAAQANPSPLSIPWGITDYFDLINAAAGKVG